MIYRSENYLQITQELKNNPSCLQLTLPLSVNPNIWAIIFIDSTESKILSARGKSSAAVFILLFLKLAGVVLLVLVMAPHLFTLPKPNRKQGKWGKGGKQWGQHSNDNRFANAKSVNTNQICITQLAWPGLVVVAVLVGPDLGPYFQVESTGSSPLFTPLTRRVKGVLDSSESM